MNNNSYFLFIIIIFGLLFPSFPQYTKVYCYEKDNPGHRIYLRENGTYDEFWGSIASGDACRPGLNFSNGCFTRKNRSFLLTSFEQRHTHCIPLPVQVSVRDTLCKNNLHLKINSPYERMIEYEAEEQCCCTYPHKRIYLYEIRIKCGDGSKNRSFKRYFNSKHSADTTGLLKDTLPQDVKIHSVKCTIRLSKEYAKGIGVNPKIHASFRVKTQEISANMLCFELPNFDYFLLINKTYKNKRMRIINDKTVKFNGRFYDILYE